MQLDTEFDSTPPSLSPIQQRVALALGSGLTITGAAHDAGLHRATVYRWLKTHPGFSAAVQQSRTEFVLSRRDDLHYLSNRAMETLLAILDNPRSSPSVLLRTSMFILQRSQIPGKGWCLPELLPKPDGNTLIDSASLEKECDLRAGIDGLEIEEIDESAAPTTPVAEAPETAADATQCDTAQPDANNVAEAAGACEAPYRDGGLPSCPVPADVLDARDLRSYYLDTMDDLKTIKKTGQPPAGEQEDLVA